MESDGLTLIVAVMSKMSGEGLPLVAFRLPPSETRHYDEFALAHRLVSCFKDNISISPSMHRP